MLIEALLIKMRLFRRLFSLSFFNPTFVVFKTVGGPLIRRKLCWKKTATNVEISHRLYWQKVCVETKQSFVEVCELVIRS